MLCTCACAGGPPYAMVRSTRWLAVRESRDRTALSSHQEEIQNRHIRRAGIAAGIGSDIGWRTFRHSYRSWLDEAGAPMTVQKGLMRHASIQTTMNVDGKAMSDTNAKPTARSWRWFSRSVARNQKTETRARTPAIGLMGSLADARLRPQRVEKIGCGGRI